MPAPGPPQNPSKLMLYLLPAADCLQVFRGTIKLCATLRTHHCCTVCPTHSMGSNRRPSEHFTLPMNSARSQSASYLRLRCSCRCMEHPGAFLLGAGRGSFQATERRHACALKNAWSTLEHSSFKQVHPSSTRNFLPECSVFSLHQFNRALLCYYDE